MFFDVFLYFDYVEKKDIFCFGGINCGDNIFDDLMKCGICVEDVVVVVDVVGVENVFFFCVVEIWEYVEGYVVDLEVFGEVVCFGDFF